MKYDFKEIASKHKKEVDSEIKKFFIEKRKDKNLSSFFIKNISTIEQFVMNGGKRLRPIALIAAYKGFGGTENVLRASLSVEFFHNCTLIEDDIMDEDDLRRNKPTVYKVLKNEYLKKHKEKKYKGPLFNRESSKSAVSNSILFGNILYSLGNNCIAESEFNAEAKSEAQRIFNEAFVIVNDGQLLDLKLEKKKRASEKDYVEMAEKKTANLVRACVEIGGVLADAPKKQRDALSKYAMNVTLAFQIADDLMDINPESKKGHELGSDIKEGKKTLLVIKALEKARGKNKKSLLKVLGKSNASRRQIKKAIEIIHTSGAVDYCKQFAEKKVRTGKQWLKKAGLETEYEFFFSELADFFIERKN